MLSPGDFNRLCFACLKAQRGDLLEVLAKREFVGFERHLYGRLHLAAHRYPTDREASEKEIRELIPSLEKLAARKKKWVVSWLRGVTSFTREPLPAGSDTVPGATCHKPSPVGDIPRGRKLLYIASCNQDYFEKYWKNLRSSWMEHDPGQTALLVNVINPDENLLKYLAVEATMANSQQIFLTTSQGPAVRAYYASSRFFVANAIMKEQNCPVYIIDTDAIFVNSPADALPLPPHDVLMRDMEVAFPWGRVQAGRVVVAPTTNGLKFLETTVRYIVNMFDHTKDQWFIDQNAIEYSRISILTEAPLNCFANIKSYENLYSIIRAYTGGSKQKLIDRIEHTSESFDYDNID